MKLRTRIKQRGRKKMFKQLPRKKSKPGRSRSSWGLRLKRAAAMLPFGFYQQRP